ncbi:hypothetical protein [Rhizobium leguminosarum]|jgi:phospholipid N-methyltransferase|uniref:HTH hxlR-type domain-containing protein n=1 Tax=Rhizobium leguminosarum bv. trifolii (strain WSM1325) TaxID=395491 RepID=C6B6D1_RHILS|nr:hypothetical protein [Rhizobium leguminosarum]ACS59639.1 hypothetical protein Rleg_6598 [Rhizobium leguminosarum bv. trifolii WSM1325]MBY2926056.1 hypothetical protein [Rhizobium leguminosarum]
MPRFDRRRFLLAWLRAPLCIASITPSGPRLAGLTYGPKCSVPIEILDSLGLVSKRIDWTLRNIPPAAVYRISRRYQPMALIEQRRAS